MGKEKKRSIGVLIFGIVLYLLSRTDFFGSVLFELGGVVFIILGVVDLIKTKKQKK